MVDRSSRKLAARARDAGGRRATLHAMRTSLAVVVVVLGLAGVARAEQLVYVEALGKAGLYGVGYERAITPRLALGGVASYAVIRDQQLATAAPYLHATLVRGRRHALFGELGLVLVHSRIPSPVATWDGMAETGAGGVAAVGWERRGRLVVRAQAAVLAGEGGVAPWLGFAVGVTP
jgi:hypothetical protein